MARSLTSVWRSLVVPIPHSDGLAQNTADMLDAKGGAMSKEALPRTSPSASWPPSSRDQASSDLADGDDDSLGKLSCGSTQVVIWDRSARAVLDEYKRLTGLRSGRSVGAINDCGFFGRPEFDMGKVRLMRRLTLLVASALLLGILISPEAAMASTTQQGKLTASDAAAFDNFAGAVAVSGNTAIVGAAGNDDAGSGSGAAYVFVRSGNSWSEQAKLTASDAAPGDNFGFSVAVSGDTVVVGAALADVGGASSA